MLAVFISPCCVVISAPSFPKQLLTLLAFVLQMYYLNPVTWTLYGLVASNVGDLNDKLIIVSGVSQSMTVPEFLDMQFGYRHDWLGWVVLILIGWIIVLWGVGAYAFKKFNFQKR